MGKFLEEEKERQESIKQKLFSAEAQKGGMYKGKIRPFCLPLDLAKENLFGDFRDTATTYFADHKIGWHDGKDSDPSNHLCDSQVCCINFLFAFVNNPKALATLLRPAFPNIQEMLKAEDNSYLTFEWIGRDNYLHEKISKSGTRTRGRNFTSADSMVRFKRIDGKIQTVLIEWKYTESYSETSIKISGSGTDRSATYKDLFEKSDCPIDKTLLPNYISLFHEPFYQLMRQQFLANEMEIIHEDGAEIVSLLHISPMHNDDFHKVTSPKLKSLGNSPTSVWHKLIRNKDRFASINTEKLFEQFPIREFPELTNWHNYIFNRYGWLND